MAVQAGDDLSFAQPGFDDSHWMLVDTYQSLKTYFPQSHPRILWYRQHVKVSPDNTGLALQESGAYGRLPYRRWTRCRRKQDTG